MRSHVKLNFDKSIEKIEFIKESFTTVSIEPNDIDFVIDICKKHICKDYEDAMQYACALKVKCTLIITNNPKDFKNSSIDIVTSKELSDIFSHR